MKERNPDEEKIEKLNLYFAGDFASLEKSSTMILIPVFTLALYRRCIAIEDGISIIMALFGIILVTQPTFIFGHDAEISSTSALAYTVFI